MEPLPAFAPRQARQSTLPEGVRPIKNSTRRSRTNDSVLARMLRIDPFASRKAARPNLRAPRLLLPRSLLSNPSSDALLVRQRSEHGVCPWCSGDSPEAGRLRPADAASAKEVCEAEEERLRLERRHRVGDELADVDESSRILLELEGRVAMLGVLRADGRDEVGDLPLDLVEIDVGADRVLDANVLRVRAHGVLDDGAHRALPTS